MEILFYQFAQKLKIFIFFFLFKEEIKQEL
jgi:hypothetical protein